MRAESPPRPRRSVLRSVLAPTLAGVLAAALSAAPARAALSNISADHDYRLTSVNPFSESTPSDFNTGFFHYVNTETTTGGGDIVTGTQDVTTTANSIAANLTGTTEVGGIASSTFEVRFTLTDPATAQLSGSAAGANAPFSGGYSVRMKHATDSYANSFINAQDDSSANWGAVFSQPIALAAGTYDLKVTASISGGAVGTAFNNLLVQFSSGSAPTGDYNGNGQVEQGDLDLVLLNWGNAGTPTGWTSQTPVGIVDQAELDGILLNWGNTSEPGFTAGVSGGTSGGAVPEPTTLALLGLGGIGLCRGNWRRRYA